MKIQEIMNAWKPQTVNAKAGVEWWNGKAAHFGALTLPTAETSMGMRLIQQENMIKPGGRILDVGCGGGRFCFALEQMGAEALGVDFSPNMIDECNHNKAELASAANFEVCNWHTVDIEANGWSKGFDLVLAHMTPAIVSAETFMKLSQASRDWCLMVKPTRRTNIVLDGLHKALGFEQEAQSLNETVAYAFDLLWLGGMNPKMDYENQIWKNEQPLEKAIQEYTARIESYHELSAKDKEIIRAYLTDISENDVVKETTNTLIAAMYWNV